MREIKFKVWDTYRNKMIKWDELHSDSNYLCLMVFDGNGYRTRAMQYTGLKDKNGREIYEGDICNCREYECFGKIEWNEDNAGFYFYVVVEGGGFDEECLYEYADELEVIGNVHDNPELLGGAG
jgi:hypothetical protein